MKPVRKLEFDPSAVEDLTYWVRQDRKKALRILELVQKPNGIRSPVKANLNP